MVPDSVTVLELVLDNLYDRKTLLKNGSVLHPLKQKIAVRKAIAHFRRSFYMKRRDVLNEIAYRPAGTVGEWDQGGGCYQDTFKDWVELMGRCL